MEFERGLLNSTVSLTSLNLTHLWSDKNITFYRFWSIQVFSIRVNTIMLGNRKYIKNQCFVFVFTSVQF